MSDEKKVNPEVLQEAFIWLYAYENYGRKLAKNYVKPARSKDFYWDAVLRRVEYFSQWYDASKHCEVRTAIYTFIDMAIRNEAWLGREKFRRRKVRVVYGHDFQESEPGEIENPADTVEKGEDLERLWDQLTWAIHHAPTCHRGAASMLFFEVPRAEWDCRLGVTRTRAAQVFGRFAQFVRDFNHAFPAPVNFRKTFRFETAFNRTKPGRIYKICVDCGRRFEAKSLNVVRCSRCYTKRVIERQKEKGVFGRQPLDEKARQFIRSAGYGLFCRYCTSGKEAIRKAMEGEPVRKITFENITRTIQKLKNEQR